jgi:hypothetical protein
MPSSPLVYVQRLQAASSHTPDHDAQKYRVAGPDRNDSDNGSLGGAAHTRHPERRARSNSCHEAVVVVHPSIRLLHPRYFFLCVLSNAVTKSELTFDLRGTRSSSRLPRIMRYLAIPDSLVKLLNVLDREEV